MFFVEENWGPKRRAGRLLKEPAEAAKDELKELKEKEQRDGNRKGKDRGKGKEKYKGKGAGTAIEEEVEKDTSNVASSITVDNHSSDDITEVMNESDVTVNSMKRMRSDDI